MNGFDAGAYKTTTRAQWQEAAKAWNDWAAVLRSWLGPATETMLDMANIGPGARVLDVAAGAGDQSLQIAARVGPSGHVLATDIAPNILHYAELNAQNAGYGHIVKVAVMDGEELDVPPETFDAVVSRVGMIYFPDRKRALAGMRRALKPGGRVALMVYSTPEKNGFFSVPVAIIRERAKLPAPAPSQPGPFSLGRPGVLEEELRAAGFQRVETEVVSAPIKLGSARECVRFERESFGALHQMLSGLDTPDREQAWIDIERELARFESPTGFEGPCELIVAVATK